LQVSDFARIGVMGTHLASPWRGAGSRITKRQTRRLFIERRGQMAHQLADMLRMTSVQSWWCRSHNGLWHPIVLDAKGHILDGATGCLYRAGLSSFTSMN
jgi:hypothetical protein